MKSEIKIVEKETIVYIAEDGKEFKSVWDCEEHENWLFFKRNEANFTPIPALDGWRVEGCYFTDKDEDEDDDEDEDCIRYYKSPNGELYAVYDFDDYDETCYLRKYDLDDFGRVRDALKIAEILKANGVEF